MRLLKRSILTGCVLLASPLALAQVGFGEGSGISSDPTDPLNWQVTKQQTGTDTVSWWDLVNGQPTNRVTTTSWSQFGMVEAINRTGTVRTGSMQSVGGVLYTVKWIGLGPAPTRCLIRVYHKSEAGTTPAGPMTVDNGINTPIAEGVMPPYALGKGQNGSVLRWVNIGSNGQGTIYFSKVATASATGRDEMLAHASARGGAGIVASRSVTIEGYPNPTYYRGNSNALCANSSDDPHSLKMDVGITLDNRDFGSGGGTAYAYLNSILWGPWNNPDYEWTWDDAPFVTDIQDGEAIHRKKLTLREIADLALNGPNIRANHVTVSDADGISDSADVVIYSHAPLEFPIWNSTTTKYSDWHNISAWIVRSPYASATVTASSSYSVAVTWKIVLGVEPTLQFSEFLKLVFKVGGEYGETATVTKQNDYRFEVPAGPANKQFAIQKRVFWKESLGQAFRYKANGYDGIEHLTETKWCSGSKDEAEKYDAQIFLAERDYDGL